MNIYDFKIPALNGKIIDFEAFKGKKILIVNTASECGYTPQYAQLQELYEHAKDELVIIGCPSNDFGNQEPGSAAEITEFCQVNYGVTFPLTQKIKVTAPTAEMHPLYQWLTQQTNTEVQWNFQKYCLDEQGNITKVLGSGVAPASEEMFEVLGIK